MISYPATGEAHRPGRIEVVCGSMFSGKTEELIRRLRRAQFAKQKVEIFKPAIDTRYSDEEVVSHDHNAIPSTPLDSSASILLLSSDIDVVGIDEAQFFDDGLVDVCNQLANRGVRVIIAGLDMDFRGIPFGPMPALCAIADDSSADRWHMSAIVPYRTTSACYWVKRKNTSLSAVSAIKKPSKVKKHQNKFGYLKKTLYLCTRFRLDA